MTQLSQPMQRGAHPHRDGAALPLEELRVAAESIRTLLQGSEREFLAVGRELHDLATHTESVVASAGETLAAASDAADPSAGARITASVAAIREVLDHSRVAAAESSGRLIALQAALTKVDAFAGEFRRIVLALRSLGILTRMEGSRDGLEDSGFVTLSVDVTALSELIQDRFETLIDRSGPLRRLLTDAVDQTRSSGEAGGSTLDGIPDSVTSLLGVNREAQARMAHVSDAVREIAASFGHIVVGLQSHDITRQQLEHVAEALEEAQPALDAAHDDDAAQGLAADVSELQLHQVRHARDAITGSVTDLIEALLSVGDRVRAVATDLGRVSSGGGPILQALEGRLMGALDVLRAGARRTTAIAASTEEVASIVAEMASFIHDIKNIGNQINLIAFNSIVRSARTGEKGRAIGVLAQEIQVVAANAQGQTAAASAALAHVATQAAALQDAMRALNAGADLRTEAIAADLRLLLDRFGDADAALARGLERVGSDSQVLQARVERVARSIGYHKRADRELTAVERRLGALTAATTAGLDRRERAARAARLQADFSRYTMESERRVHAQALSDHAQTHGPEDTGDLGANIELF